MSSESFWSSTSGSIFSSSFLTNRCKRKGRRGSEVKEKPRNGGKIKGAVKVNPRRGQRITRAGVCLPAEPWSSRAERAFCPGCAPHALVVRSLFRAGRGEDMELCPPRELWGRRVKTRPCQGGGKSTWTGAPSAKRREGRRGNRKEGLVTMFWKGRCLKTIRKGWPRAEDLCVSVLPHTFSSIKSEPLQQVQLLNLV